MTRTYKNDDDCWLIAKIMRFAPAVVDLSIHFIIIINWLNCNMGSPSCPIHVTWSHGGKKPSGPMETRRNARRRENGSKACPGILSAQGENYIFVLFKMYQLRTNLVRPSQTLITLWGNRSRCFPFVRSFLLQRQRPVSVVCDGYEWMASKGCWTNGSLELELEAWCRGQQQACAVHFQYLSLLDIIFRRNNNKWYTVVATNIHPQTCDNLT
jgi:hypothetical protein